MVNPRNIRPAPIALKEPGVNRRSLLMLVFGAFAIIANTPSAFAHAALVHADPAVGSTMQNPPARVTLWFTEEVEPAFSSIHVFDSAGHEVDRGDVAVNASDQRMLTVSIPRLPRGSYKVAWQVVSVDSHKTHGSFGFAVGP
jgi:methionine-rich copper-binding protein CopC